jgi:hypothetical protein
MRGLVAALGLLSGCADIFDLVPVSSDAGATVDADASGDTASSCPFGELGLNGPGGAGLFSACLTTEPAPLLQTPATIDTRMASDCTYVIPQTPPLSESVCVIVAVDIEVASTTRALGSIPLVLVATHMISVTGTLDASSARTGVNGPGNNYASCPNGLQGQTGAMTLSGAGGAGATFQSIGGAGGNAESDAILGGTPAPIAEGPTFIRGGCRGGQGGLGGAMSGGTGGAGGGAIYLIAGDSITISSTGLLNVSAEGGAGGSKGASTGAHGGGGGGGGSGGLIGLDAPAVTLSKGARLIANGGGGGGGAGVATGGDGDNGKSALTTTFPFPADGGPLQVAGGNGGNATAEAVAGANGGLSGSGGGGGGGLGYIKIYSASAPVDLGAISSPAYN